MGSGFGRRVRDKWDDEVLTAAQVDYGDVLMSSRALVSEVARREGKDVKIQGRADFSSPADQTRSIRRAGR